MFYVHIYLAVFWLKVIKSCIFTLKTNKTSNNKLEKINKKIRFELLGQPEKGN